MLIYDDGVSAGFACRWDESMGSSGRPVCAHQRRWMRRALNREIARPEKLSHLPF